MIKVCHMTSLHARYDTRIYHKMCRSLASNGYDVTLLVADRLQDELKDGIRIISTGFIPKNRVDRIINSKKIFIKKALELDCAIYHIHDPELIQIGLKLQKYGKRVIFDSHENVPGQISEKKWIPFPLRKIMAFCYKHYERYALTKLSGAIGARTTDYSRFSKYCKNVRIISNFPISLDINKTKHKKMTTFSYAGGITQQWNHEIILTALDKVDAFYDLMGNGPDSYLAKLKKMPGWKKVVFRGKVPSGEVRQAITESIAGIALLQYGKNTDMYQGNLSNTKLFEYMNAGIPVICTDFKIWQDIINEYQCGICINPRDIDALIDAMTWILQHPEKALEMGKQGRKAIEQVYNWTTQENILLEFYSKIALEAQAAE
ncbi:glycosyltransferase [bacterium]|nr:glycosyltransferase [bacterium]